MWFVIIPLIVLRIFAVVTLIYTVNVSPGNLTLSQQFDPASGQPLPIETSSLIFASLINGITYGTISFALEVIIRKIGKK